MYICTFAILALLEDLYRSTFIFSEQRNKKYEWISSKDINGINLFYISIVSDLS